MWDNILATLAGGVLGAGGAIASQWLAHYLNDGRTRRAIAGAFAGEIGAVCSIIRYRKYLEHAKQALEYVRQSQQPFRLKMIVKQEYFSIYHSNSSAIGLLPARLAMDIAKFYTQAKALLEDVHPDAPEPQDAPTAESQLTNQIELLEQTLRVGDATMHDLEKVAQ